jgi:hypothetical protein
LKSQLTNQTSSSTQQALAGNPAVNAAIDTANQAITGIAQSVVATAISKVNLTPIQNATQQFFTLYASVTSFGTEVAMAFARNTGTNLLAAIATKDATAKQIQAECVALYNACAILLGGQPFFNQMLQNMLQAYSLMVTADANLKNVSTVLASPTNPFYQTNKFNVSITQLQQAAALILPNPGANISSIRGVTSFVSSVVTRQSNLNTYAAALAIPGITLKLAQLVLNYELQSIAVNAYLNTFLNTLSDYIANYKQSPGVNQATIDHINAGTSQLDNLIASMNVVLSANTNSPTNVTYKTQLSTSSLQWGVQLTGIIAWLKANPGAGSALLSQTSASVSAYNKACAQLNAMGNLPFSGGTLIRTAASEDASGLILLTAKFITAANLIIVTQTQSAKSVLLLAQAVENYALASIRSDTQITAAIQPFLNTKTTLSGPVNAAVQQLINFSNKMGLDRVAGLLTNGKVADLFSTTPNTSTYAGAAVTGMNSIISTLRALPSATTQQISQLEGLRDQVKREQTANNVYAGRSAASTQGADTAQTQAKVTSDTQLCTQATATAQQLDSTVTTTSNPGAATQAALGPLVTPGGLASTSP